LEYGVATIRDVAQLAGVSTATVSHVLNSTRAVSEQSKDRVLAAMEQLNYQPNAVARSLRVSETLTIGLIVPDVEIPFFAWVARCIEDAARDAGYSVILCNSGWSFNQELRYLDNLRARRVDGLICISVLLTNEHVAPLLKRHMPVVWFEQARVDGISDAVVIDNVKGAYDATTHLIAQGHHRIGCVLGLGQALLTTDRIVGYRQALSDAGIAFDAALLYAGDYEPSAGLAGARQLLALPEPPTAIFAFNDMMALGALQAANERGLRVPDQLALIGFDGIALTEYTSPPLSTVRQPIPEMCRIAISMLLDRINDRAPNESRTVLIEPTLVKRASTLGLVADTLTTSPYSSTEAQLV
jgi:LacI family transcriptional regulator